MGVFDSHFLIMSASVSDIDRTQSYHIFILDGLYS